MFFIERAGRGRMVQSGNPGGGKFRDVLLFFRQDSCAWLAAVGFAFALFTWYPGRLGITLQFAFHSYMSLTDFIAIGVAVAAAIFWTVKPAFRFSDSKPLLIVVAVVSTLCFILQLFPLPFMWGMPTAGLVLMETLYKVSSVVLVLLWLEQVDKFPARYDILIIGAGCVALALLELLLLALQSMLASIVFVLSPLCTLGVLTLFLKRWYAENVEERADASEQGGGPSIILSTLIFCLAIFVYSTAGSSIQSYLRHTSELVIDSVSYGVLDALGMAVCGLVLVAAGAWARRRSIVLHIMLIMPSILILTYVFSLVMPENLRYLTYALLALSRRLTIVFWVLAAIAWPHRFMVTATAALATYRFAQTIGTLSMSHLGLDYASTAYSLIVVVELVLVLVLCPLIAYLCLRRAERPAGEGASAAGGEADDVAGTPSARPLDEREAHRRALENVIFAYGLSSREADVLFLLDEGWRAGTIAEKLVLSPSTVKNHMNSIYGKLGVHSQDELRQLVEQERQNVLDRAI